MEILYRLRVDSPASHRARFSVELGGIASPTVDLVLPSWVPGSYVIVNYSRGVRDVVAHREPDGAAVPVDRIDKARWRVRTGDASRVRIDYTVYGHQLVTEGFDLTPDHLFVNAAPCLPFVDGHRDEPVTVALELPAEWKVITDLEPAGGSPHRFRAPNYDALLDSPIDAGTPLVLDIAPGGIPHRICLCGRGGNYDAHALEVDIGKIVEATVALVGESPLSRYTFFLHLSEVWDGGLEHANSMSCVFVPTVFRPAESYRRFLSYLAHEYFHLYNVKRIRPKALDRFDYTRETYTRLLWWMEGTTDYFGYLTLRRAGLLTADQYLDQLAKFVKTYLETPGRNRLPVEELSQIAWVDLYRPFEETPNQTVSYYLKGNLLSTCLDLEIRHRTDNRASLETVLRLLWNEYGKRGIGIGEDELLPAANRATGLDLTEFFDRFVRGTDELDIGRFAGYAGLAVGPRAKTRDEEDDPEAADLGVSVEDAGGIARVRHAFDGRPGQAAGLSPGDEIIALDGVKVTYDGFPKALERCLPGSPVELAVFRRGFLERVWITPGPPLPKRYAFVPVESPSELAQRVYEGWIGVPWTPRKAGSG